MIQTIGEIALNMTLAVAAATLIAGVIAGLTGSKGYYRLARYGVYASFALVAVASLALLHAFVTHQFQFKPVYEYSDAQMPLMYIIAAFWGGQSGSLTFYSIVMSLFTSIAVLIHQRKHAALMPWFIAVSMLTLGFLVFILVFASSPFETFAVVDIPTKGNGLNPLLQTPLMVIHPPALLTGFIAMGVPFAFGMAAMLSGRLGNEWLVPARVWALVAWVFLSAGNMLGGMWAYEELGWGGYWAWDPVENAAFMPWLAATAFIHSIMVQERRGMLKRWNMILISLTFLLTLMGTFITRSGLIDSVHTFAQSDIGDYFFALLITFVVLATVLLVVRWKALKSEASFDSPLSREAFFLGNNWILVGMTFVVFWGTLFPKINEMLTGDKVSVGPPWFIKYMVPLGIVMLVLMGIGTVIAWKKSSRRNFRNNFLWPLVATAVLAPAIAASYWLLRGQSLGVEIVPKEAGFALGALFLIVFVLATIVSEYTRGVMARVRSKGENVLEAIVGLITRQRRRYGGYIVHAGFVLVILGWSGNAMKIEQDVSMKVGESAMLGDFSVRYDGLSQRNDPEKTMIIADITVLSGTEEVVKLQPARAIFNSNPESPTSEITIRSTPLEDLYFALVGFSQDGSTASFKMVLSPLTWWFWFGGTLLIFGTIVCLWPQGLTMPTRVYSQAAKTAVGTAAAAVIAAGPLVFWTVAGQTQSVKGPQVHEHGTGGGAVVDVRDPRMAEIMSVIRTNCVATGRPTMANSSPTCSDYQSDLRIVRRLLAQGKTNDEIFAYFVELRGPDTLAMPSNEGLNWLSWALPLALMGLAVPLIIIKMRKWTAESAERERAAEAVAPSDVPAQDGYRERLRKEIANS